MSQEENNLNGARRPGLIIIGKNPNAKHRRTQVVCAYCCVLHRDERG